MHIGQILRRIRKAKLLTLTEVSDMTNGEIVPSYLSRMEREELQPSYKNMVALSNVLGFSLDDVTAEMMGKSQADIHNVAARFVPIISWVEAGEWTESPYTEDPSQCDNWLETPKRCGKNSFALEVRGNSMTTDHGPSFPDKSLIIVDPDLEPANKSLIVAMVEGSNEATFKQLIIDSPYSFLRPLNPQYPVLTIDREMNIVGTVVDVSYSKII